MKASTATDGDGGVHGGATRRKAPRGNTVDAAAAEGSMTYFRREVTRHALLAAAAMLLTLAIAPTASAHDPTEIEHTWRAMGVATGIFAHDGSLAWTGFRYSGIATFAEGVLLIETKTTSGQGGAAPSYQLWFYVLDEANRRIIVYRQCEVFLLSYLVNHVSWGVTLKLSVIGGGDSGTITYHRDAPVATTPTIPAPD